MVYAVLSEIGQFLPACLQLGPENGPEDFQYVSDEVYTLSPMHAVRLNKVWGTSSMSGPFAREGSQTGSLSPRPSI